MAHLTLVLAATTMLSGKFGPRQISKEGAYESVENR